jgi:hypothetical protein
MDNCNFTNNTINVTIEDNPSEDLTFRETAGVYFSGGGMVGGRVSFDGLCQDVILDSVKLNGVTIEANIPENQIVLRNCLESDTTFDGDTTKIGRWRSTDNLSVKGYTTDATATTVFKTKVAPGEVVSIIAHATAERQNSATGHAIFIHTNGAKAAPNTLNYDDQTANFTVGKTIVGATSGATAVICADSDSGTTGTLSLCSIDGEFLDNEIIAESDGTGSARANGAMAVGALGLAGAATVLHAIGSNAGSPPSGWNVTFVALGQELLVKVTGASSTTILWNVRIEISRI